MKAIGSIIFLIFAVCLSVDAETISWHDWNEGQKLAKEQQKPVMVFVHATWCHLCQRMDTKVFQDDEIVSLLNDHYIPVKLDAEYEGSLKWEGKEISAGKLLAQLTGNSFRGIPAYIFIPANGKRKNRLEAGLKDVEEMKELLIKNE